MKKEGKEKKERKKKGSQVIQALPQDVTGCDAVYCDVTKSVLCVSVSSFSFMAILDFISSRCFLSSGEFILFSVFFYFCCVIFCHFSFFF